MWIENKSLIDTIPPRIYVRKDLLNTPEGSSGAQTRCNACCDAFAITQK